MHKKKLKESETRFFFLPSAHSVVQRTHFVRHLALPHFGSFRAKPAVVGGHDSRERMADGDEDKGVRPGIKTLLAPIFENLNGWKLYTIHS